MRLLRSHCSLNNLQAENWRETFSRSPSHLISYFETLKNKFYLKKLGLNFEWIGEATTHFSEYSLRKLASDIAFKKTITIPQIRSEEEFNSIAEVSSGFIRQGHTVKL